MKLAQGSSQYIKQLAETVESLKTQKQDEHLMNHMKKELEELRSKQQEYDRQHAEGAFISTLFRCGLECLRLPLETKRNEELEKELKRLQNENFLLNQRSERYFFSSFLLSLCVSENRTGPS